MDLWDGIAVLLALRFGLKVLFSGIGDYLQITIQSVRYAILGLWAGFAAPWLFEKLQLASDEEASGCREQKRSIVRLPA